jgi:hypothetical protein
MHVAPSTHNLPSVHFRIVRLAESKATTKRQSTFSQGEQAMGVTQQQHLSLLYKLHRAWLRALKAFSIVLYSAPTEPLTAWSGIIMSPADRRLWHSLMLATRVASAARLVASRTCVTFKSTTTSMNRSSVLSWWRRTSDHKLDPILCNLGIPPAPAHPPHTL